MRILQYGEASLAPEEHRRGVKDLLDRIMNEGAVVTDSEVFHQNCRWSIALQENKVVGLLAYRVLSFEEANVVLIRGAYVDPTVRGRAMMMRLQAAFAWKVWMKNPLKPLYWASRTRNPAVFMGASRVAKMLPNLSNLQENQAMAPLAQKIIRMAYGERASLDPETFVLHNSFPEGTSLLNNIPRAKGQSPTHDYFEKHLDYGEDQNIFLMTRFSFSQYLSHLWGRILRSFRPLSPTLS